MLGIKHIIVAVNKMDLVGFKEVIFEKIKNDYAVQVLSHMNFSNVDFIPVSALSGLQYNKKIKINELV